MSIPVSYSTAISSIITRPVSLLKIIALGEKHEAESFRLNPNQFLSSGHRKEPNRVSALLIQSACGWREYDCAIMSSLISFSRADRQAIRPAWWGWYWKDARGHKA